MQSRLQHLHARMPAKFACAFRSLRGPDLFSALQCFCSIRQASDLLHASGNGLVLKQEILSQHAPKSLEVKLSKPRCLLSLPWRLARILQPLIRQPTIRIHTASSCAGILRPLRCACLAKVGPASFQHLQRSCIMSFCSLALPSATKMQLKRGTVVGTVRLKNSEPQPQLLDGA